MKVYIVLTNNDEIELKAFSKRELAEEYATWLPIYNYPEIHEIEVENELHLDKQYHVSLEIKCFYNGEKKKGVKLRRPFQDRERLDKSNLFPIFCDYLSNSL